MRNLLALLRGRGSRNPTPKLRIRRNISRNIWVRFEGSFTVVMDDRRVLFWLVQLITTLKRKELIGKSIETPEHLGIVDSLPLDQHIGVRIPGGQPNQQLTFL